MNITVASANFAKIPMEILHLQLPAPVTASGAPTYTCSLHKPLFELPKHATNSSLLTPLQALIPFVGSKNMKKRRGDTKLKTETLF